MTLEEYYWVTNIEYGVFDSKQEGNVVNVYQTPLLSRCLSRASSAWPGITLSR